MWAFVVDAGRLLGYYLAALLVLPMLLRAWRDVPDELVRKTQHLGYGLSIWLLLLTFERWTLALAASLLLVAIAYPALLALERWRHYRRFFPDRRADGGELRRSMLWVQASFAVNLALFWGLLGPAGKPVLAAGVMAWTFGDAAAALVGRWLGRHHVVGRLVDGAKTEEGAWAMSLVAAVAVALSLRLYGGWPGPPAWPRPCWRLRWRR